MRNTTLGALTLASLLTTAALADTKKAAAPKPGVDSLVAAERDLTFDLAKKILPGENAVFSPASVHIALGMTYAGARGTTEAEMARTLRYDRAGGQGVHDLFGQLSASLAKLEHKDQSFRMANRLFGQKSYPWSKAFLATTAKAYGAALEPVDFGASDKTRKYINGWVEAQTNKKIVNLLPEGSLTPDTRMVLTNAVYFKGAWKHQFEQHATAMQAFAVQGKTSANVPMMNHTDRFLLGGDATAQVLEMPYSHGDIAMDIILPAKKDGLAALESKLDGAGLAKLLGTMKTANVEVKLPKFKLRTAVPMAKIFQDLGMKSPFQKDANFDGLVEKRGEPLWIDQIYHQGFVEVDEKGTEAAAATAVVITTESSVAEPPKGTPFHADRPFIWIIRDLATGEILFYGRVVDPR
jgi:serpin B